MQADYNLNNFNKTAISLFNYYSISKIYNLNNINSEYLSNLSSVILENQLKNTSNINNNILLNAQLQQKSFLNNNINFTAEFI